MDDLLIRYLHFVGIILLASTLVTENVLLSDKLENRAVKKLAMIDGFYGLSALLTLGAGLLLWLVVGKPSTFYSGNILFQVKLGLFIVIALISIIPTVFLLKNRSVDAAVIAVPKHIILIKRFEFGLLLVLPLLAVLMARGIGST